MTHITRRAAFIAAFTLTASSPALARPPEGRGGGQGHGRGHGPDHGHGPGPGGPPGRGPRFGAPETAIIRDWRGANPGWAPRPLPPGQMRQLARGRPLPPGIARQTLPPPLLAQLPVHPGYSYALVGTTVVLLGAGAVVVDILPGLF